MRLSSVRGLFLSTAFLLLAGRLSAQISVPTPTPTATPKPSVANLTVAPDAVPLDPWLTSPTLWQATPEQFPAGRAFGFRWVSTAHDAARTASTHLRLRDLPVAEVIARFAPASGNAPTGSPGIAPAPATLAAANGHAQLAGIQISIFNRGDTGELDEKGFDGLVEQAKISISALSGAKPMERGTDYSSAVQSKGLVWVTPASRYLLEWSATAENKVQGVAYRAEFLRLKITPEHDQPKSVLDQMRAASGAPAAATPGAVVRAADLPARIVKDPDGGVRLPNIPMVDQGQKGYCVTAATERVLRYYGRDVDQNELAQVANTSATGGTSTADMVAALKKLASRFKVTIISEIDPTYADFTREIDDYNRAVRAAPKSPDVTPIDTRGSSSLSIETIFDQMSGPVLRDARTKFNPAFMTRFEQAVETHINRGIPLLWSVQLGLLPEKGLSAQDRGAHMRLIIGYNSTTKEIYYSDTWGRGHELKKMPLADAWTITWGLYTLEPS